MCGIFGIITTSRINQRDFKELVRYSQQRGQDSSGLVFQEGNQYKALRADHSISRLVRSFNVGSHRIVLGHSRLITNGLSDNQPVIRDGLCAFHNGIIVNHEELWKKIDVKRRFQIDTEIINGVTTQLINDNIYINDIPQKILDLCQGVISCALLIPKMGKLCLFSNNGSLYLGSKGHDLIFASENYPLRMIGCKETKQVKDAFFIDVPVSNEPINIIDSNHRNNNLIPALTFSSEEENLLENREINVRRCSKCILPETMPFIKFDQNGVCNYCHNYRLRNVPRPKEELFDLVEQYRRKSGNDCIVPFSGGRDSCYGLHLVVKELKMKPVAYTYDWGMVTDLGRRNISRMCAQLGVENIIVADDIARKRQYIRMNLLAWLKSPHLGMVSILTAGDKHFFRHVETIKKQTCINLNLWGVNPLEVTHFKAGFLGIPPNFEEKRVYSHGVMKQLRYHYLRFNAMLASLGYFNSSLWDTLSGEYYRSFTNKKDYYHIYDYWRWDEKLIDETLAKYDWEKAPDTNTTWRIGDGTAAFYNYIYYTVAGFTEHDTFRSNQIREGEMSRELALNLVNDENRPRYPNIRWYLDAVGVDFKYAISTINKIPRLYK